MLARLLLCASLSGSLAGQQKVDFARQVQPILSDRCYHCHGPDAGSRKAELRLDLREVAVRSGAVVPGDPSKSLLVQRILHADPKQRMPPRRTGKELSTAEIETLRRWIAEGAVWGRHWSFVKPQRPPLPVIAGAAHPIDRLVRARLAVQGMEPSPPADRRTLIRRLSFDLTGLPPSPAEVAAYLADRAPGAYERVVDRLLASPRYGERMAMVWLDVARYADTDGYQADATRANWPWRDWVVQAYNDNIPFDEMTRLQFAGDLREGAPPEATLATCFHRNHMANGEGGRLPEESRVDYVIDRVNTVGTAYLGMTLGCAQCHDHKFDPLSQRDYYALSAFFDSIDEDGRAGGRAKPFLEYRSSRVAAGLREAKAWLKQQEQKLQEIEQRASVGFAPWLRELAAGIRRGAFKGSFVPPELRRAESTHGSQIAYQNGVYTVSGPNPRHEDYTLRLRPAGAALTGMRLSVLPLGGRLSRAENGHVILTNLKVGVRRRGRQQLREVKIAAAVADHQGKAKEHEGYGPVRDVLDDDPRTGWATFGAKPGEARVAVFRFAEPLRLAPDEELQVELRHRSLRGHSNIRSFRIGFCTEPGPAVRRVGPTPAEALAAVQADPARLEAGQREALRQQFLAGRAEVVAQRRETERARRRARGYERAQKAKVMVLRERQKPRTTHVLTRGVWNQKGAPVTRDVPRALGAWRGEAQKDRSGLAEWLVDGKHPLTARVAVNRYWQMYFGRGLVATPEDFGRQGALPSHPALLDWLAVEFVDSGWDIKHLQRLIVTSATYRQTSDASEVDRGRDPANRWLARGARFRLPSWMIRDAALAASGLLNLRMGGPPVYPYQPPGVWQSYTMGRFRYEHSVGSDVHRRSIYSFWRRSVAPTSMFDASRRRNCQVRVVRTNTPQHALTVMNDLSFVEAARVMAGRMLQADGLGSDAQRAGYLGLRLLARPLEAAEWEVLQGQLQRARRHYLRARAAAEALVRQGTVPPAALDPVEHAAWTLVSMTLLNLDETLTRS